MKQILCYDSLYNTITVAGTAADMVACREFRCHVKERAAELLDLPENELEELLEMGGDQQTFFYNEEAGSASFLLPSGENVEITLADAPDPLRDDLLIALKEEAGLDEYAPVPPDKKEEWEKLQNHPNVGVNLLMNINFLSEVVPYITYQTERVDGSGSPEGLKGQSIPLGSRIIAVSDAYCAMTSDRPYRKAMDSEKALSIMKEEAGRKWDEDVINALIQAVK